MKNIDELNRISEPAWFGTAPVGGGMIGSSILKIVSRLPKIAVLTVHFPLH